jgi:hypothetical protein
MARNDDGEFELVLGNTQLLSGFFIIVILFGIFFTMGYIVGRHSSPTSAAAGAPDPVSVRAASPSAPPPGQAEVVMPDAKQGETAPSEPPAPVVTQPATAAPEAPHPAEIPKVEARPAAGGVSEPATGTYLQVAAPKRAAAEGVVESLRNKSITAVLAPGPNAETVRVLVGPLDSSTVGKMRLDLEAAGFKPFLKKY